MRGSNGQDRESGLIFLSAGQSHSCVVHEDGSISCWGWNREGQLGTGSSVYYAHSDEPEQVSGLDLGESQYQTETAPGTRERWRWETGVTWLED